MPRRASNRTPARASGELLGQENRSDGASPVNGACAACGHGSAVHHGVSEKPNTECSVLLGPRGVRCGCKRFESAEAAG